MSTVAPDIESRRADYERDGFCLFPVPIIPPEVLDRGEAAMDDVIAGKYATGREPLARDSMPGDDPRKLVKIDQPQPCDDRILELVTRREIGETAAELLGADMIQVWAVQLLHKPAGGVKAGSLGWHQDDTYWNEWWKGEVFTCWVALSEVSEDTGPVVFIPGSHQWGFIEGGNALSYELDSQKEAFQLPEGAEWNEVKGVLPRGGFSFHHRRTIHGSGPNLAAWPRRSYAVHMRTEKSEPLGGNWGDRLDDPQIAPVIFQR